MAKYGNIWQNMKKRNKHGETGKKMAVNKKTFTKNI